MVKFENAKINFNTKSEGSKKFTCYFDTFSTRLSRAEGLNGSCGMGWDEWTGCTATERKNGLVKLGQKGENGLVMLEQREENGLVILG